MFVKLEGKTVKGRNKLREAGSPNHWIVTDKRDYVSFSDRVGPWLLVRPDNNQSDKSRWVNMFDDWDFVVNILNV
jgi:hypothetical protein